MASERMSGPDVAWLHMDRPENLMIVNTLLWFDEPPDWGRVEQVLQDRLVDRHRRFRQRAADPPITLGLLAPTWVDVPDVRAGDHMVRATLPPPAGTAALHAYVAEQARRPLDRSRPLWQAHVIEGLGRGAALLLRTHHAIGDGSALMEVIAGFTDPVGSAGRKGSAVQSKPPRDGPPAAFPDRVAAEARTFAKLSARAFPQIDGPRRSLDGSKTMSMSAGIPLADLRRAGEATASTVNDVVLAALAAALATCAGDEVAGDLDVVIPVDLRTAAATGTGELGNHFGLAFVALPLASTEAADRMRRVTDTTRRIKQSRESAVVLGSLSVMGRVPAPAQRAWVDAFIGRSVAVVTNVRGPAVKVALAGTPVTGMGLWVPSTGPLAIGVSAVSYADEVVVGLVVDNGGVPERAELAAALFGELADLTMAR